MKTRLVLAAAMMCGVVVARGQEVHAWRYTTEKPGGDWFKPGYDVSGWKEGQGAFGTQGTPGMNIRTVWSTSDIWLVRTFGVSEAQAKIPALLRMIHDEDTTVYINGVEACKTRGYITNYKDFQIAPDALKTIKVGENTVAVHCINTGGGQGIDADVVFDMSQVVYPEAIEFTKLALGRDLKPEESETIAQLWTTIELGDELLADWLRQDLGDPWGLAVFKDGAVLPNLQNAIGKVVNGDTTGLFPTFFERESLGGCLTYYRNACMVRRSFRLKQVEAQMPRVLYARHFAMGGSHYAYTEALSDAQYERSFQRGGQLCMAEYQQGGLWKETVLLESKEGIIRDVDVDFDARRVLFSWKKSDREDDYSLYEVPIVNGVPDVSQIRQLTDGLGIADYEGCYLPDGSIMFISTRCQQIVDCYYTEVSNIYRCDADGKNILRLGFDQVHVNYPTVTWDNRVLYTRWEYNDRSQMYPQPLFQMMPDGTAQSAVYGENAWFPTSIVHARAVPGSQNIFAVATGHHSRQPGELIYIEPGKGRQETEGITIVAPVREPPEKRPIVIDAYGQDGALFLYPYPLDEKQLLVTHNPIGWNYQRSGNRSQDRMKGFGLYWMDIDGNRELITSRMALSVGRVVPLAPRKRPPERPSAVDYTKRDGTFYVQDVYVGEAMEGVPRGTVKTLRVVELDYRIAGIGNNGNSGPGGAADISTPVAIGNGAWDPKILVGDARVHPDGSVFFTTDARRPVYFILLDAKGRMVQTMRSWTTLQPGENASCVGCHEPKNSVPLATARPTQALAAGAQRLTPIWTPSYQELLNKETRTGILPNPRTGFSFLKDIQPILDRNCITCHDGKDIKSKSEDVQKSIAKLLNSSTSQLLNLLGTAVPDLHAKRNWTQSYLSLTHAKPDMKDPDRRFRGDPNHKTLNWVSAASAPPIQKPLTVGSNTSAIFKRLDDKHCETIKPEEIAVLAAWVDLAVPFCGDYVEANTWNDEEMAKHERYKAKRDRADAEDAATLKALGKK